MKHTKGKWWIDENRCIASGKEDNYKTIAEVLDLPDREWRANANLIASAPELLKLAKDLYNLRAVVVLRGMKDEENFRWDEIKSLIAKAEGENNGS